MLHHSAKKRVYVCVCVCVCACVIVQAYVRDRQRGDFKNEELCICYQ